MDEKKTLQSIEKLLNNIEKLLNGPNIEELLNEPSDELFIDSLFAYTKFYELGRCFRRHPDVLKRFAQVSDENALKKIHSQCTRHLSCGKGFTIDIDGFESIIPKFTFQQRVELLEANTSKTNLNFLEPFFSFEELRSLLNLDTRIRYRRLEAFFVNRLILEKSAHPEEFATEVLRYSGWATIWMEEYPNFLTQLQRKEVYFAFFKKIVALLAADELKPLEKNTLKCLESLASLLRFSPRPIQAEIQERTLLKKYSSQQLYTFCLQLQLQTENPNLNSKKLQNLFYPLCFELLTLTHLQQLKKQAFPTTFRSALWPNPLTRNLEETLSEKVKTEDTSIRDWSDVITTRRRNFALLLFLIGVSLLIPGLVLNVLILWAVAIAPLVIGFGIVGIPLLRTAFHSLERKTERETTSISTTAPLTTPGKTLLLDDDNTPTQSEKTAPQDVSSAQPDPTPFKPMLQPSSASASTQNSDQTQNENVEKGTPSPSNL